MTNWYSIFYWLTVADSVKSAVSIISVITLIMCIISLIGYFVSTHSLADNQSSGADDSYSSKQWKVWVKAWKTAFITTMIICFVTSFLWMFAPSKKDALIIIAGGVVGNFVTQDTSARQLPSEVMQLLRVKIKEEINESSIKDALIEQTDTLKDKTKEELLEIIKKEKK